MSAQVLDFTQYQAKRQTEQQAEQQAERLRPTYDLATVDGRFRSFMDGYGKKLEAYWAEQEGRELLP